MSFGRAASQLRQARPSREGDMDANFIARLPHPFYGDHVLYHAYDLRSALPVVRAWEFKGWRSESMSWKNGCYIHAGLSSTGPVSMKGPEAKKYLQSIVINSLEKFPIGSMKHGVMCNEDGLIVAHGIIERKGEDHFESYAGGPPGANPRTEVPFNVEIKKLDYYLFQIAGPTSLQVLEKVTGESLRSIGFLRFRDTRINGIRTEVGRIGMTGNLAYELHGPIEEGPAIYDAVYRAGEEFGIERLGWGTYLVNHIEGGFPQSTWTFVSAAAPSRWPEMMKFWQVSGSVDPTHGRARHRTPVEVKWHNMARFDHDFVGREALAAEIANPKRTTVTLRWNPDDVMDTYASLLRPGEAYKPIDLPYAPQRWPMAHADHVLKDGREIGYSSGTIYSYAFREFLSLGCLDIAAAGIGNEVVVQWGDHGGAIKSIRATVARFPYLTEGRNSDVDATQLPTR
jgi:glycine cleavage system aminomethyltransferase T